MANQIRSAELTAEAFGRQGSPKMTFTVKPSIRSIFPKGGTSCGPLRDQNPFGDGSSS
jgi:hypothetical protein